jgi:hypothetical protein
MHGSRSHFILLTLSLCIWQSYGITLKVAPKIYGRNTVPSFFEKYRDGSINKGRISYTANAVSKTNSTSKGNARLFDLTKCLMDVASGKMGELAWQAQQTCGHAFSCVGAFSVDNTWSLLLGTFCAMNAYEQNLAPEMTKPINEGYLNFLHNVMIPMWEILMMMVSMVPSKRKLEWAGKGFMQHADCSNEESGEEKLICMMTHARMLFQASGGKPDFSELSMSQKQADGMKSKLERLHAGFQLLQTARSSAVEDRKFRALEQAGGGGGPRAMYNTPEDDVPIPGPLNTSLVNPPSKNKFPHVSPGLPMMAHFTADTIPEAVCNDGSSGVYYLAEGSDKTKFHFHVAGGYFCNNMKNCRKRIRGSPMLASTKGYEEQYDGSGIFDPKLGGFPGWTHAFVTYCSSDAWFGQTEVDWQVIDGTFIAPGKKGTHFRGYTIIDAMLKKYSAMGLGLSEGQELLVSSCSAGAIGIAAQGDSLLGRLEKYFKELYPSATFYPPHIVTALDNMPIFSPDPVAMNFNGNKSLFDQSQELVDTLYVKPGILAKTSEFLNAQCVAAHEDNPGACVFPGVVLPYIQVPNLVLHNLQDSFLLFNPYSFGVPLNEEMEGLVYKNELDFRKGIALTTPQQNQWAIACNDHCLMLFSVWWRMTPPSAPNGMHLISPKDMMLMTMTGDTGKIAMDDCHAWNCGCAGIGPYYFLEMVKQYCWSRTYIMFPEMMKPIEEKYNYYLRLPKDPDRYPDDDPALVGDDSQYADAGDLRSAPSSGIQLANKDASIAQAGDICVAYIQLSAYQGAFYQYEKTKLEAEIGK